MVPPDRTTLRSIVTGTVTPLAGAAPRLVGAETNGVFDAAVSAMPAVQRGGGGGGRRAGGPRGSGRGAGDGEELRVEDGGEGGRFGGGVAGEGDGQAGAGGWQVLGLAGAAHDRRHGQGVGGAVQREGDE